MACNGSSATGGAIRPRCSDGQPRSSTACRRPGLGSISGARRSSWANAGWLRSPGIQSPSRRFPDRASSFAGSGGSIWRDVHLSNLFTVHRKERGQLNASRRKEFRAQAGAPLRPRRGACGQNPGPSRQAPQRKPRQSDIALRAALSAPRWKILNPRRGLVHPGALPRGSVEGPILEPWARPRSYGSRAARARFLLCAPPIFTRTPDSLVPDIKTGADVFDLKSLAGYRFIVTNLPYREQAAILAHLLPIAARDGVRVAVLARSKWSSAAARRALVHENARFAGEVRLTKRPEWFVRRSRRRAIGSAGSFGRRSRARLAKIPFCASLTMCRKGCGATTPGIPNI